MTVEDLLTSDKFTELGYLIEALSLAIVALEQISKGQPVGTNQEYAQRVLDEINEKTKVLHS